MPVTGWKLDRDQRAALLQRLPPVWPDVIADHITLNSDVPADEPLPSATEAEIVGSADDDNGLQAIVVAIGGTTVRPDGGTYHITWSLDRSRGRQAVESNDVIAALGWQPLPEPIPIQIEPARFG